MDFSKITIKDKLLFDTYLETYNPQASELTFTNLFMWRDFYNFRYTIANGFLCIIAVPDDKEPFAFIPVGNTGKDAFDLTLAGLKEYFRGKGWQMLFNRVEENNLPVFREMVKDENDMVFDRDNSDYIYLAEDLTRLPGKKFDGKRNHINRFKREYEFEYVDLTTELIDECSRIMREWCAERECDQHKGLYCERLANTELLDNYGALDCKGALIKVNGRYEAFTVGEMLNSNTAVIHIEKANGKINGLYPLINQQFCENQWKEATFINREQDLGLEGLRRAKLSYNPVKLISKYTIILK